MKFALACLLLAGTICPGAAAFAQSAGSERCDWADCAPAKTTPDSWKVAPSSLPRCTAGDRSVCGGECRKEFDDRFHACVDTCLSKRCVVPTPTPVPQPDQEVGAPCVEIESPICEDSCKNEAGSRQPRCRRDCLQKACPDASPMDVTSEGLDPGTFRCERCKKRIEITCSRNCSLGMTGTYGGLERYGCQRACVMANCNKACGIRLPF